MSTYITTNTPEGKAIFSTQLPVEQTVLPRPFGNVSVLWSSQTMPPTLLGEEDITAYGHDRTHFFAPGTISPANGSTVFQLTFQPGAKATMHRTMTIDVVIMIAGVIEIHLDSGEMRTLRAGDVVVQRGTIHEWRNVSPDDGEAKFVACVQSLGKEFLQIGDKELGNEGL